MKKGELKIIFDHDYRINSDKVKDQRVFKVVERKFNFLKDR